MSNESIILTMFFGTTLAALLFGNRYLKNKERMFMIEKGISPHDEETERFWTPVKLSLLLMGGGLGLFIAFLLSTNVFVDMKHVEIVYFSLMSLLAGLAL